MTWSYRHLLLRGLVSRKRGCKRAFSEETIRSRMQLWLHCLRERILQPQVPAAAPASPSVSDLTDFYHGEMVGPNLKRKNKTAFEAFSAKKRARTESSRVTGKDYGGYKPAQRIHIDQVPFSLDNQARRTFVHASRSDMAMVSGAPGTEKRFGTAQIAFHGDASKRQMKIGACFFNFGHRN